MLKLVRVIEKWFVLLHRTSLVVVYNPSSYHPTAHIDNTQVVNLSRFSSSLLLDGSTKSIRVRETNLKFPTWFLRISVMIFSREDSRVYWGIFRLFEPIPVRIIYHAGSGISQKSNCGGTFRIGKKIIELRLRWVKNQTVN